MPSALVKGGIANLKRDEAPRRQPESLEGLDSRSANRKHTANQHERKTTRTKSVIGTEAGARPYSNVGHVKEAIAGLCRLVKYRHGQGRAMGAEAGDLFRAHLALEAHACALDASFVPEAERFAQRCLRLGEAQRAAIRQEVADHPQLLDPAAVGEMLGLTDAERNSVKFRRADAIDLNPTEREAMGRERRAARKRELRKAKGATPRSECLARQRELHPGMSKSTFYRRAEARL